MKIKQSAQKLKISKIKESKNEHLTLNFTKITNDKNGGILKSSDPRFKNEPGKILKILRTLLTIREKTADELIRTPKNQIGGHEKCDIKKWNFSKGGAKKEIFNNIKTAHIISAGRKDGRIIGYIDNGAFLFYV